MVKKRVVIALGGNALQKNGEVSAEAQKKVAEKVGSLIAELSSKYEIVLAHGNGPQVGNILIHEEQAASDKAPAMPLETAVAMSQGQIGYWLAQSIQNAFLKDGKNKKVATVVTQVEVDKNDLAFDNPTKPIGSFYTKDEIENLPFPVKEDAGRGYRRVIASPKPVRIVEENQIKALTKAGFIVISCGGGGIPVYEDNNKLIGIDAVIDKDFASSKLASDIDADILLILTAVKCAKTAFNTPNEKELRVVSKDEIKRHLENNEFKEGSMKPKVVASLNFLDSDKKRAAIITDIVNASLAIDFKEGTIIKNY